MKTIAGLCFLFFLISCGHSGRDHDSIAVASALDSLKKDIKKYPDSALLREYLLQYWRDQGSFDSAIAEAKDCLKKDSSNPRWWYILSTLAAESGDTLGAIQILENSLAPSPDGKNFIMLGTLYADTRNERALEIAKYLKAPRANAPQEAYFISGTYFLNTGNPEKAAQEFNACLEGSYTFMEAYSGKARALYELKKFEEAAAVMEKAVTVKNNFSEGYYVLGMCREAAGKKEEAVAAYETALQYDPEYEECAAALKRLEKK